MTNKEALILYKNLNELGFLKGKTFAIAVIRNKRFLKEIVDIHEEMIKPHDTFISYEQNKIELGKKHALKDENGNYVFVDSEKQSIRLKNPEEYKIELHNLNETYKEVILQRNTQIQQTNEWLEDTIEVLLNKITENDLPDDISVDQLDKIFEMVG